MQFHQQRQEELTEQILRCIAFLKENSRAALTVVQDDISRIEEVESLTDKNVDNVRSENARLEAQKRKSSRCTMILWMVMMAVMAIFMGMYMLMRVVPK